MPVFTANIPEPFKVGDRVEIGGKIREKAKKMSVNLCLQQGEEPKDVVLHFDVRFHRDNIISLSRKNGIWIGSGNYDTNYNMFVPGTVFRIIFEIKDVDVITIYCQGKFHSNFLPKIPLCMAKFVVAWGDMERVTHCFFNFGVKKGCQALPATPSPWPIISTTAATAAITDDLKCQNPQKHNQQQAMDSKNITDKLYDSLMYPNRRKDNRTLPNNTGKYRSVQNDYEKRRTFPIDSEKLRGFSDITELSDCSEEISKTVDYTNDNLADLKKRRKIKFPFSHVVNCMFKSRRL